MNGIDVIEYYRNPLGFKPRQLSGKRSEMEDEDDAMHIKHPHNQTNNVVTTQSENFINNSDQTLIGARTDSAVAAMSDGYDSQQVSQQVVNGDGPSNPNTNTNTSADPNTFFSRVVNTNSSKGTDEATTKKRKGPDGTALLFEGIDTPLSSRCSSPAGKRIGIAKPRPLAAATNQPMPAQVNYNSQAHLSLLPSRNTPIDNLLLISLFERATGRTVREVMEEVTKEEKEGKLDRTSIFRKVTRSAFNATQQLEKKPKDSTPPTFPTAQVEKATPTPQAPAQQPKPISYAKAAQSVKETENWTKVTKQGKKRAPATVDPAMTVEDRLKAFLNTPPPQKPKGKSTKKEKPRNTAEQATKLRNLYVKCDKQLTGFGKDKQGNLPLSAIRNQFEILGVLSKSLKNIQYVGDNIELTVSETALLPVKKILSKYSKSGLTVSRTLIESEQATMDRLRLSCETLAKTAKFIDVRSFFEERSKELTAPPKEVTAEEPAAMDEDPGTGEEPQATPEMEVEEPINQEVLTQC